MPRGSKCFRIIDKRIFHDLSGEFIQKNVQFAMFDIAKLLFGVPACNVFVTRPVHILVLHCSHVSAFTTGFMK